MQGSRTQGRPRGRLLVVDDDHIIQLVLAEVLGELGYEVSVAGDGQSAMDALGQSQFDLVLMDCQMPEMDGATAVRNIRSGLCGAHNARIPIIALTASSSEDEIAACMEAGMNAHIGKPIDAQVLASEIGAQLEHTVSQQDASRQQDRLTGLSEHRNLSSKRDVTESVSAFIDRIVGQFMEEVPGIIDELKGAVAGPDVGRLLEMGHKLRGSASIIGASAVAKLAAELESAAKAGDQVMCERHADRLTEELNKLLGAIEEGE